MTLQVLEEVGYDIKVEDMRPVTMYVSATGVSGAKHHMFFAAVSESMRSNGGGGLQYVSCTLIMCTPTHFLAVCHMLANKVLLHNLMFKVRCALLIVTLTFCPTCAGIAAKPLRSWHCPLHMQMPLRKTKPFPSQLACSLVSCGCEVRSSRAHYDRSHGCGLRDVMTWGPETRFGLRGACS